MKFETEQSEVHMISITRVTTVSQKLKMLPVDQLKL